MKKKIQSILLAFVITISMMFSTTFVVLAGENTFTADSDMGYYAIYNDSRHQDIVANNNFQGQSYVTVSDGQYLLLSRCHIEQQ